MEIETILKYLSFIPNNLNSWTIELLQKIGLAENLSARMSVLLYWLIIFILVFVTIKFLEKINWIVKIIIFLLAFALIIGFFLPVW